MKNLLSILIATIFIIAVSSADLRGEEASETGSNFDILDVNFEPIHEGKNVVRVKVQNSSDKEQIFGIHIQTKSSRRGWGHPFFDTIKSNETKLTSFDFEINSPFTDAGCWIRLQFYNPVSADKYDFEKWFKKIMYTYKDLLQLGVVIEPLKPASKNQVDIISGVLQQFQSCIKNKRYQEGWQFLTKNFQSVTFQDDYEKFRELVDSNDLNRIGFFDLKADSATTKDGMLTLTAKCNERTWTLDFVKENGQWKIDFVEVYRGDWKERLLPQMQKCSTKHFDIYYFKNSTAEKEIDQIAEQKEKGFGEICKFLGKDSDIKICMVFFENGQTKRIETGHQGAGWAFGRTIVEVYNQKEKLDPYHETAHILMDPAGNPPALFDEGFAVYISEKLGAQALKQLGGGQSLLYQRCRELKSKGEWINLGELLTYTEIGSPKSKPPVAYAEAASFVKFLIDMYGKDKFLEAYKTLRNSDDKVIQQQNVKLFEQIYGKLLEQLEKQWENTFLKS